MDSNYSLYVLEWTNAREKKDDAGNGKKKNQNMLFSSFYASIRTLRSLGLDELTSKNCRTHTLLIEIEV